jgi:hypothetical protein
LTGTLRDIAIAVLIQSMALGRKDEVISISLDHQHLSRSDAARNGYEPSPIGRRHGAATARVANVDSALRGLRRISVVSSLIERPMGDQPMGDQPWDQTPAWPWTEVCERRE